MRTLFLCAALAAAMPCAQASDPPQPFVKKLNPQLPDGPDAGTIQSTLLGGRPGAAVTLPAPKPAPAPAAAASAPASTPSPAPAVPTGMPMIPASNRNVPAAAQQPTPAPQAASSAPVVVAPTAATPSAATPPASSAASPVEAVAPGPVPGAPAPVTVYTTMAAAASAGIDPLGETQPAPRPPAVAAAPASQLPEFVLTEPATWLPALKALVPVLQKHLSSNPREAMQYAGVGLAVFVGMVFATRRKRKS